MEKTKLFKFIMVFVISITLLSCKNDDKKENLKTEIINSQDYKEVIFTKSYKTTGDIRELNIQYNNFLLKFRFIEDITLLQFVVDGENVSDWKQILFNFEYLPDNYDGIRLLFDEKKSKGILLLPGYTEQYPNLIAYEFDEDHFSYLNNFNIKDEDLNKISFENLNKEWKKGSFKLTKKSDKYILTFCDVSKKNILNFESSVFNDLLPETEIKKYIDKVTKSEKAKSNRNYSLSEFLEDIKKKGLERFFEKKCDLNQDNLEDEIYVFWDSKEEKFLVYIVLLNEDSSVQKTFENENILTPPAPNSTGTGLNGIKWNNYDFTFVDNISEGPTQTRFITFQYDKINKQIKLQKYSIVTTYADESKNWENTFTTNNFGEVQFIDYDSKTIDDLCNNKNSR
ncbi:hypothetical protein ABXT06_08710 [Flavobacterium sp. UW10123]|uniref:hypothetical protein n=1 Tax=Flavobacterium sp. UW10123 TaxID=3230800 RepID=UPI0033919171